MPVPQSGRALECACWLHIVWLSMIGLLRRKLFVAQSPLWQAPIEGICTEVRPILERIK